MAFVVTFNNYREVAETKTADIVRISMGATDITAVFTEATYPIDHGDFSFTKYVKVDFAGMASESITQIANAKFHKSAGTYATEETLGFDGLSVSYATPTETDASLAAIPITLPGTQNVGLGGSDTGVLTADGESDYMLLQRGTGVNTPEGALDTFTLTFTYDVS